MHAEVTRFNHEHQSPRWVPKHGSGHAYRGQQPSFSCMREVQVQRPHQSSISPQLKVYSDVRPPNTGCSAGASSRWSQSYESQSQSGSESGSTKFTILWQVMFRRTRLARREQPRRTTTVSKSSCMHACDAALGFQGLWGKQLSGLLSREQTSPVGLRSKARHCAPAQAVVGSNTCDVAFTWLTAAFISSSCVRGTSADSGVRQPETWSASPLRPVIAASTGSPSSARQSLQSQSSFVEIISANEIISQRLLHAGCDLAGRGLCHQNP